VTLYAPDRHSVDHAGFSHSGDCKQARALHQVRNHVLRNIPAVVTHAYATSLREFLQTGGVEVVPDTSGLALVSIPVRNTAPYLRYCPHSEFDVLAVEFEEWSHGVRVRV